MRPASANISRNILRFYVAEARRNNPQLSEFVKSGAFFRPPSFRVASVNLHGNLRLLRFGKTAADICKSADTVVWRLRLRVRRGEDGNGENDGEGGEDSISNSPQGECYIKLSGGGGGGSSVAYHKPRQKRKRRKRALAGDAGGELAEGVHCGGNLSGKECARIILSSRCFSARGQ